MLRNFFKVALRNLYRQKGFTGINIAGLALGLTACLLIGLFVWDEQHYDRFVPDGDKVYRVINEATDNEGTEMRAAAPPMFAATLQQEFPEVAQTARVMMLPEYKRLFEAEAVKLYEASGTYVDSTFFSVLPLPFTHGSPVKALDDPASIVISEELSQRLFGKANPVGKRLLIEKQPFVVKGVFQKHPKFHLQYNYLLPLSAAGIPKERMESWGWQQFYNYVKLKPDVSVAALETKFRNVVDQHTEKQRREDGSRYMPHLQPLKDIHLYSSDFKFDNAVRGNITYVKALTIIALFILLIACFNFVNLATAKSLQRAKEVGVRKSIGATRKQLLLQFTGETVLLALISMAVAVILTLLLLPALNAFTGKELSLHLLTNPGQLAAVLLLGLMVGLLAGFYPALVLSGFQPVKVLKGSVMGNTTPGRIPWLRHGLVVLQFTLSVLLIICALVVLRQVAYLHNKDLGFDKEELLFFPMRGDSLFNRYEAFKNDLMQVPGVSAVSIGYGFPGDALAGDQIIVPGKEGERKYPANLLMVDHDYVKTLDLKIIAGRNFSRSFPSDKNHAFIVNETALKQLGLGTPEQAIGKTLLWPVWNNSNPDSIKRGTVIGVVKDFHVKSLYDKVETAVLQIFPDAYWKVAVKIKAAGAQGTIGGVTGVWNRYVPDYPLEYTFLDESFAVMYKAEDKLKSLLWIFTGVTIFVACLGLFGLAAYAAERRKKEVGIRKVLGASVQGIVALLSKEFIRLVLIALFVAAPIAWYCMHRWLQAFSYRIDIGWGVFVLAAVVSIAIALITVSFQAIKAAIANPVKSLRTE